MTGDLILGISHYVDKLGLAIGDDVIFRRPVGFEAPMRRALPLVEFANGMTETIVLPSQIGQLGLRAEVARDLLQATREVCRGMLPERGENPDGPCGAALDIRNDPDIALPMREAPVEELSGAFGAVERLGGQPADVDQSKPSSFPRRLVRRRKHVAEQGAHHSWHAGG